MVCVWIAFALLTHWGVSGLILYFSCHEQCSNNTGTQNNVEMLTAVLLDLYAVALELEHMMNILVVFIRNFILLCIVSM